MAIDFGTTYSGFAFSFIKDQGKDDIFMNLDWVNEQGGRTSKTPTCLLLKPDLSFDSFGYDAIEKYAALQGESEEKEYLFFKHFKMALHSDEVGVTSVLNRPFPCSLLLLLQNESNCVTFHTKLTYASILIFMQIKVIFMSLVSHSSSL